MTRSLKDKVVLVTGSSRGIGRAIALDFAKEGVDVALNCSASVDAAEEVAGEIRKLGRRATVIQANVAEKEAVDSMVRQVVDEFGRIDILVNNAGNFFHRSIMEMTEPEWDSINTVHLKGHFACCQAAAREMIRQKSGRIINMSSIAACGGGGNGAYSTVKAGILGFSSALSLELMEHSITVNVILPSADTELFPGWRSIPDIPDPISLDPDYIPPIVLYLATDEAQNITNRFFYCGGGDICIYALPLQLPGGAHFWIRKPGKWTVDELGEVLSTFKL